MKKNVESLFEWIDSGHIFKRLENRLESVQLLKVCPSGNIHCSLAQCNATYEIKSIQNVVLVFNKLTINKRCVFLNRENSGLSVMNDVNSGLLVCKEVFNFGTSD